MSNSLNAFKRQFSFWEKFLKISHCTAQKKHDNDTKYCQQPWKEIRIDTIHNPWTFCQLIAIDLALKCGYSDLTDQHDCDTYHMTQCWHADVTRSICRLLKGVTLVWRKWRGCWVEFRVRMTKENSSLDSTSFRSSQVRKFDSIHSYDRRCYDVTHVYNV